MSTSIDGLIVDVSDPQVSARLEEYRKTAGEDGEEITRRQAASRLLAEALNHHFDEEKKVVVVSAANCGQCASMLGATLLGNEEGG